MVVVRTVVCPDRDAGWTPVVSYGSSVVSVWVADTNTVVVIPYCNHVPHYSRLGGMGVESRWLTPPYQGTHADGGCSAVRSSCGSKYWSVVRLLLENHETTNIRWWLF